MEQKYRKTYAKLCSDLGSDKKLTFEEGENSKKSKNIFKNNLLSNIQKVFEGEKDVIAQSNKSNFLFPFYVP